MLILYAKRFTAALLKRHNQKSRGDL